MKKLLIGGGLAVFALFALCAMPAFAAKKTDTCATIKSGTIKDTAGEPISLGYDKWGYNYQANMFNGWYDNYSRPATVATSGDRLMMKWNDAWLSNKDCEDADSKLDRHYGLTSYIGSGAWLTNHASGTYEGNWNVTGTWNFDVISTKFPGTYPKTMTISQDLSGNITGTGNNVPAGYTWNVTGNVSDDSINFSLEYNAPMDGYVATFIGTIKSDGKMEGTWFDVQYGDSGTWSTTSGNAVRNTCEWSDFVKIVAVPGDATQADGYWYSNEGTQIGQSIWGEFAIIQEVSNDPCNNPDLGLMNYKSQLRSGLGNW